MFESRGNLLITGLLLFLTLFLPGCKSNNTLQNGIAKTQLSGATASSKEFKFTLPTNTQALMIQSGTSDQVELQLLDTNKNPIPVCNTSTFCRSHYLAAGDYYVQLNGLGEFSNLSLVASWSGPEVATLKNAVPVTGLSGKTGTVILQSLHVPFYIGDLNLQTTATGSYTLELLDSDGTVLKTCDNLLQCTYSQTFNGNYFVRITGVTDFSSLNILASWGGAGEATIQNGVPVTISGSANSEHFESLYIEPGTQALMLQKRRYATPVFMEILNENGQVQEYCDQSCVLSNPAPGLYYVRSVFAAAVNNFSFTAVWGGENGGQLKNGVPLTGLSGSEEDILLKSVYIPENTHALMLHTGFDANVHLELLGLSSYPIWSGSGHSGSAIPDLPAGLYFVRIILPEDNTGFALTAAWGSNETGTLQNGIPLTGLSGNEHDALLQSVYIPENTHALMLQTGFDADVQLELLDSHGYSIWNGSGFAGRAIQGLPAGLYFVRIFLHEALSDFALTATWGSNGTGTLQNGIPFTGLSGNEQDVLLQSVYIPENTHALMLQTGFDADVQLELLDSHGYSIWNGSSFAGRAVQGLPAGLYFVRIFLHEALSDFALTATWGSNGTGTLQNGIPLTGLSGNEQDVLLQSVYIPENTHALMLQTGFDPDIQLELLDSYGYSIWNGSGFAGRAIQGLPAGLYFVRIFLHEALSDFALTATWGSNGTGTLQNSIPLTGLSGNEQDVLLQSVYIQENTHALMLQTGFDADVQLELLDSYGYSVWNGSGFAGRAIQGLPAGLYFVRIFLHEALSDFTLAATWGSNGTGTLQNGIPLTGLSGNEQDVLLQSVYIPANAQSLTLQTDIGANVNLELVDFFGYSVWNGPGNNNSSIPTPPEGLYFVRIFLPQDTADLSLTATWNADPPNAE